MIGIIDYGVGNVQSIINLYKSVNIPSKRVANIEDLKGMNGLILPGVGHFDYAMKSFNRSGLREKVEQNVCEDLVPILGICVGMQMLANRSEEGRMEGLGWIPGQVKNFRCESQEYQLPLPHMGWNSLEIRESHKLLLNKSRGDHQFYFLHSYYFLPKIASHTIAYCKYGVNFSAVVSNKNIHGVQFHPEKSHHWGINLLMNFASLCKC